MVRAETDKKTNDFQTRHFVAWGLERYVWCVEMQREAKVGYRETEARQCQKIAWYLLRRSWWWRIQRYHEECAQKVVKFRCQPQCFANFNVRSTGELVALKRIARQRTLALLKPIEPTRKRMEGSPHKNHEDHIAGKGMNPLSHNNLVRKIFPLPRAMKENTRCKSCSGKRMWKTRENTSMAADESQKQKWGDRWSKEWGQNRTLRIVDGSLSSQEFGVGATVSKHKGWVVLRGDTVKDDPGSYAVFTEQGSSASQNDGYKSNGYHVHIARLRRRSSWRSIGLHPGQCGRRTIIIENSQIGMSRHMDSSTTTTSGQNHGPAGKTQSFLLSEICTVILWQDYHGKGNLRKSYWNTVGKRFRIGNAYSLTEKRDYSHQCKNGWKETENRPDVESTHEDVDLGEPTWFLHRVQLGCTQRECRTIF